MNIKLTKSQITSVPGLLKSGRTMKGLSIDWGVSVSTLYHYFPGGVRGMTGEAHKTAASVSRSPVKKSPVKKSASKKSKSLTAAIKAGTKKVKKAK